MATTSSTVSKRMLAAVKTLKSVRDPSSVSDELSSLPSEELYLLKGIAESALTQAKQREEAEKEAVKRQEREKEEAENQIFNAMRPLPMYKDKSDNELKALITSMNKNAFKKASTSKAKPRRPKSPKPVNQPDSGTELNRPDNIVDTGNSTTSSAAMSSGDQHHSHNSY